MASRKHKSHLFYPFRSAWRRFKDLLGFTVGTFVAGFLSYPAVVYIVLPLVTH